MSLLSVDLDGYNVGDLPLQADDAEVLADLGAFVLEAQGYEASNPTRSPMGRGASTSSLRRLTPSFAAGWGLAFARECCERGAPRSNRTGSSRLGISGLQAVQRNARSISPMNNEAVAKREGLSGREGHGPAARPLHVLHARALA